MPKETSGEMTARDWIDDEPGLRELRIELARFRRHTFARPLPALLVTLALASLAVVRAWRDKPLNTSRMVFRVTEGDLDLSTAPPPTGQLLAFVSEQAFSTPNLQKLARARGLYASDLRRGADAAVEAFRDDIVIEVWRNYFLEERSSDDPARSARVAVSYRNADPQLAFDVLQDLGALVGEANQSRRLAQAKAADDAATVGLDEARRSLALARSSLANVELRLRLHPSSDLAAAMSDAKLRVEAAEARRARSEARKAELDLRVGIERRALGVRFELADGGRPADRQRPSAPGLLLLALLVAALALPLSAITLGAFDPRVHDSADLERLGLVALGHLDDRSRDIFCPNEKGA